MFDCHLMIEPCRPLSQGIRRCRLRHHHGACRGYAPHLDRSLQAIRELGKKAGVSLNPSTPESVIEHVLDRLDLVLLMSVNPGFGGQAFIPSVVEKTRRVKAMIGQPPDPHRDRWRHNGADRTARRSRRSRRAGGRFRGVQGRVARTRYRANIDAIRQAANERAGGLAQAFISHSCSGALWNFHVRFGPAMTLR